MTEEKTKKSKTTKIIIILVVVLAVLIAFGIGGYFAYEYSETNKSTGTEWGDTYYSYLKSVKNADEEKVKEAGLTKDIKTANAQFIQVKKEDNPKMVLNYQKNNETYTNIYFIDESQKVSVITYEHPTTLELLYNRELKEYLWYLYYKENGENLYKSLDKILKEKQGKNVTNQENEPEATYADYTFKDTELESKLDVADGEIPVISEFDKTFIKTKVDNENISEISFEENDKELKQSLIQTVEEYKTKEKTVTEEVKTETNEQNTKLDNKQEEIKQLEEKKRQEEEVARKAAEEAEKAKAKEIQTGEYKLQETARDGALKITSASANSVNFQINVVNLFGGYHLGEVSGTAIKNGDKYVFTSNEFGQTYKLYMEAKGNTIEVTTSKMLNGDGFDPYCGANAYFDGTYAK